MGPHSMGNLFSGNWGFWTGNFQLRLNAFLAVKITANNYRSILRKKQITAICITAIFLKLRNYGYMHYR